MSTQHVIRFIVRSCVVLPCMLKHVQMKLLLNGSAHGNTLDLLKSSQHFKSAILPVNIITAKAFTTPCISSELVITVGIFRIWPINSNLLRQFMYHTFSMVSRNVPTFTNQFLILISSFALVEIVGLPNLLKHTSDVMTKFSKFLSIEFFWWLFSYE